MIVMKWTREQVIAALEGMIWIGGLCRTEKEALQAAIDLLKEDKEK